MKPEFLAGGAVQVRPVERLRHGSMSESQSRRPGAKMNAFERWALNNRKKVWWASRVPKAAVDELLCVPSQGDIYVLRGEAVLEAFGRLVADAAAAARGSYERH
jgi:hypothetical protein